MIVCPFAQLGRYAQLIPGLEEALAAIENQKTWQVGVIPLSGGNRILVQEYTTKDVACAMTETHRNYLDVQYVLEGEEWVGWAPQDTLTPLTEYSPEKDLQLFSGEVNFLRIQAGNCYVVFPEDGHMPGIHLHTPSNVRKMVLKLKL